MPIYSGKQKPLRWTSHAKAKMNFYRLSEQRVRRVLISPKRIETGIAPETIAMMQPVAVKWAMDNGERESGENGKRREFWTQEIWVMVEEDKKERKIISAWRYPGMTKPGESLPDEILSEIRSEI